ncbi:hypothetical protein HanRHA438_Chr15g0709141 [Helianthus annuus]|nr:hypothetical protein HanOQP8_Chr15g0575571 [Helianthus annuus]KAJ0845040.1 hypothetical protein HanRHA438_Chr15g0709141 [Helianthus annuus]
MFLENPNGDLNYNLKRRAFNEKGFHKKLAEMLLERNSKVTSSKSWEDVTNTDSRCDKQGGCDKQGYLRLTAFLSPCSSTVSWRISIS